MLPGFVEYHDDTERPAWVYLLYRDEELVYIGSTVNLLSRLGEHKRNRAIRFNRIFIKTYLLAHARDLEAELIARYKPKYNISGRNNTTLKLSKPISLTKLGLRLHDSVRRL